MSDEPVKKAETQPEPEDRPFLRGRIISGMPLSVAAKKRITARFEELTGARVSFTSKVEKKQIAGVRVELDGYSYDETVHGQLLAMLKMMKAHGDEGLTGGQAHRKKEEP